MSQPDPAAPAVDGRLDEPMGTDARRSPSRMRSLGRSLRRHLPLRLRAGVAFGLLSALLSVTLSAGAYVLVRSSLMTEREEAAQRQAFTNARLLRGRLDPLPPDMTELLASLQVGGSGDSLLRIGGQWFSSSVQTTSSEVPDDLARTVAEGDAGMQVIDRFGEPALAVGVPIAAVGGRYFEISSLAEVEGTLARLGRALAVAAVVATALGGLLGAALTSVLLRPLRRFAMVAKRITGDGATSEDASDEAPAEGPARLEADGDADLQPLADSFNEMLDELDERIARERRFASDVSHEIRGPVAALASALSIIERRRDRLPEDVVPVVDALDEQVTAFNQLVLDLLEISRFDARTARLDTEPVDLRELSERLVRLRGYDAVAIEADGTGPVQVDRRRVEQVLSNLLENAAHYAGGATDLRIEHHDGAVRMRVEDRGPGVPPGERDAIFGRFERGSAAESAGAPGSGLGLALSRQHVELHGGRIWVEDRPGGGACFVVELPCDAQ